MPEEEEETWDAWKADAACRGMDSLFLAQNGESKGYEAKRICATCVVREPCLEYAIQIGISIGVWGGMNRNELIKERRARLRNGRGL